MLRCIDRYYATAADQTFTAKLNERNKITAAKIERLIAGEPTPWNNLVQDVKASWPNVTDLAFRQFPSYMLTIGEPADSIGNEVYSKRQFSLCVSLLGNFYTLFFEEQYYFQRMKDHPDDYDPSYRFYFRELLGPENKKLEKDFHKISRLCQQHFPDHQYIRHTWSMLQSVPDLLTDQGESPLQDRTVFACLFDDQWITSPYKVLN